MTISFFPSQNGVLSQEPLPYTADPRKLLAMDLYLMVSKFSYVLGIFFPLRFGSNSSPWDELYPSRYNVIAIIVHTILVLLQLGFFISIPAMIFAPLLWIVTYVAVFWFINTQLCRIINGRETRLEPSTFVIEKLEKRGGKAYNDELWIFLNGVAVGKHWLQSNIDRLSLTFGRRVHGVHNTTDGIIFDLIQCMIQRNLYFATNDIRTAYVSIKEALFEEKVKKVVFITHSQGGIEGGLIIDWLLAEVPQENMRRLEVYTFGNAANHFNNPKRLSQRFDKNGNMSASQSSSSESRRNVNAIGHIEHYANVGDYVAQIGVLHYAAGDPSIRNRFMGRLFVSPNSGHLLNQHYLHQMFQLDENDVCLENNEFMNMDVDLRETEAKDERELTGDSVEDLELAPNGDVTFISDVNSPVSPLSLSTAGSMDLTKTTAKKELVALKVKNLSRLWLYRNGRTPPDDIIRRSGTA